MDHDLIILDGSNEQILWFALLIKLKLYKTLMVKLELNHHFTLSLYIIDTIKGWMAKRRRYHSHLLNFKCKRFYSGFKDSISWLWHIFYSLYWFLVLGSTFWDDNKNICFHLNNILITDYSLYTRSFRSNDLYYINNN